jgi:hypothetical protein
MIARYARDLGLCMLALALLFVCSLVWSIWVSPYIRDTYLPNGMHLNADRDMANGAQVVNLYRTSDGKLLESGVEMICFNHRSIRGNLDHSERRRPVWTRYGHSVESLFAYATPYSARPTTYPAYFAALDAADLRGQANCYCHKDFGVTLLMERDSHRDQVIEECGPLPESPVIK